MQERLIKYIPALLLTAAGVGAVWLAVRFLLPWVAPFLVALALAALLEGAVRALVRHGWRRGVAAGLMTLAMLAVIGAGLAFFLMRGLNAMLSFAGRLPALMQNAGTSVNTLRERIMVYIAAAPEETAAFLQTSLDSAAKVLYELPGVVSQWLLNTAGSAAQSSPNTFLFIVTAGLGTYFCSASFPRITAFIAAQLPAEFRHKLSGVGKDIKGSFGGWLRAQLILMAITFFELLISFMLIGVKNAAALAAVTSLIDALPVFGTGIVLMPWSLYSLLTGGTGRAVVLAVSWAVINLVRSCTQAKLLGDQIGLDPIVSLLAIYVGWRVWGVGGMLLFPILFVTVQQLNDRGIIKLWRTP